MIWFLVAHIVRMILDLLALRLSADKDKDLELLVLRQQIRILQRRVGKPVRATRAEKLVLMVTAVRLKAQARKGRQQLQQSLLIFLARDPARMAPRTGQAKVDVPTAC